MTPFLTTESAQRLRVKLKTLVRPPIRFVEGLGRTVQACRFARRLHPSAPQWDGARTQLEEYFDDHTSGRGIWKFPHYFPIYHRHLDRFVNRPVHLLEIGVYSGGSLTMWRDYLGDQAAIYGVDIEDCSAYAGDRIEIFQGDQADATFWESFKRKVPRLDIVIDDGGHKAHQQAASLQALLPHLAPGGVYIIEDIAYPHNAFQFYLDALSHLLNEFRSPTRSIHHHIESIHQYALAAVIEKPESLRQSFEPSRRGSLWGPQQAAPAKPTHG